MSELPYIAIGLSMLARFVFMYLLWTKKSTNIYSLTFCILSVTSSSLWIPYGISHGDIPILVRSGVEIVLLTTSGAYIVYNRYQARPKKVRPILLPTNIAMAPNTPT